MRTLLILFFSSIIFGSCIDRINIEVPDSYSSQLVVDGLITDEPGPYTVRLTKSVRVEKFLLLSQKTVSGAVVTISDNVGNSEVLTEKEFGIYKTKRNGIQGVVGREYAIKIETIDGKVFESKPDKMNPVGEFDSLYYELETFQPIDRPTQYGFRIYVDSQDISEDDNFLRWKFTGTYEINASPELHGTVTEIIDCIRSPRVCAYESPCPCCKCWVTKHEDKPHLSNDQFVLNGRFKKVETGYIPLEYFTFQTRYRIEVKQMSLSRTAFDYWNIIKSQKEGAASLFQAPTGKTRTNIYEKTGSSEVQGIFYASSVKTKHIYISKNDVIEQYRGLIVPRWDCETDGKIAEDCRLAFPNSSNVMPFDWK